MPWAFVFVFSLLNGLLFLVLDIFIICLDIWLLEEGGADFSFWVQKLIQLLAVPIFDEVDELVVSRAGDMGECVSLSILFGVWERDEIDRWKDWQWNASQASKEAMTN